MSTMYTLASDQRYYHVNNVPSDTWTYVLQLYQAVIKEVGGAHLYVHFRGPYSFITKTKQSSNPPHYCSEHCLHNKLTVTEHVTLC